MQVGQALARIIGVRPLCQAQLGLRSWDEVLPKGLYRAAAWLGWQEYLARRDPHFLSSNFSPMPWLKFLFLCSAEPAVLTSLDPEALRLERFSKLSWSEIPVGKEADLDAEMLYDALRAMCLRARVADGAFQVETAPPAAPIRIDLLTCTVEMSYLFPPALGERLRQHGAAGYTLELSALAALPEVAERLRQDGASGTGRGYVLTRHPASLSG
jgi:hypothetical protein